MSDQQRRRRESPASDLRAVAAHAVRMYLEVACGRRPPRTMTSLATPLAAAQLQQAAARARESQEPGSIHRIALRRPTRDSAEITALIRDHDGHVSAVTNRDRVLRVAVDRRLLRRVSVLGCSSP